MSAPLESIFTRLRAILRKQKAGFSVKRDTPGLFALEGSAGPAAIKAWGGKARSATIPVAWVEIRKNYVSYHLMGIYLNPGLEAGLSAPLRAHKHGKACFNFKEVDEKLFDELAGITAQSIAALRSGDFVSDGPVAVARRRTAAGLKRKASART
jgi:hypothetical protein